MRDLYELLVSIYTAEDLDWRIPVFTGIGLAIVLALLLPMLMPWTGFFPLLLQSLLVVAGLAGGIFFIAYGGWLCYQLHFNPERDPDELDDDDEEDLDESSQTGQTGQTGQSDSPSCPKCRGDMTRRSIRSGVAAGKRFWVCKTYPGCRGMLPIRGND